MSTEEEAAVQRLLPFRGADDEESFAERLPPEERRRAGAYFTPAPLARWMVERAAALAGGERKVAIVDPACGAGAFLAAAAERLPGARLYGLELSEPTAAVCRARVPWAEIRQGDALRGGLDALCREIPEDHFEIWIGNPPYNGTSPVLEDAGRFRALQALLPEGHELPRGTSLRDDYAFFLLLAAHRLQRRRGALALLTSATLLDAFLYAPVRSALLGMLSLEQVVELGAGVFSGTRVRTCVTLWRCGAGDLGPSYRRRAGPEPGFSPERLSAEIRFRPRGPEWVLRPEDAAASALDRLWRERGEPLTTLVPVSLPGLKTRFDELLADSDPARLLARVAAFLGAAPGEMAQFAGRHGIPAPLVPKLAALREGVPADMCAEAERVRPFFRYAGARHRGGIPPADRAFCYLDRRLIPRGDHRLRGGFDPHAWPEKLVFNLRELPLAATVVVEPGCIHMYRHARFAPLFLPRRILEGGLGAAREGDLGPPAPNLSPAGLRWAERLGGPLEAFRAIASFINSPGVQQTWAPAFGASRVLPVPLEP